MILLKVYQAFTWLAVKIVRLAALWSPKARLWSEGRTQIAATLAEHLQATKPVIWMHCASLGEFEQGRPVFEKLRQNNPDHQFLLSFFSPSGYEIRKNYAGADAVCYLPEDLPRSIAGFINGRRIELAIFVKYDIWPILMQQLKVREIPVVLIAAAFRPSQVFFKPWGGLFRQALHSFDHIFVQNGSSSQLLHSIGYDRVTICGDPRIDRVLEIAAEDRRIPEFEYFLQGRLAFIAGSTWPQDEAVLYPVIEHIQSMGWAMVIVPHETGIQHIESIERQCPQHCVLFSNINLQTLPNPSDCLIVDKVGMLASIYRYGIAAYIGGGFGRNIHNILEPAAFGIPVIFGPNHTAFAEAQGLIHAGGGFSISGSAQLTELISGLSDQASRQKAGKLSLRYLQEHQGATTVIARHLQGLTRKSL